MILALARKLLIALWRLATHRRGAGGARAAAGGMTTGLRAGLNTDFCGPFG
jgi:hypothetical protein